MLYKMLLTQQNECGSDYYNIFSTQFFQTLGQLTAGLLSTAVLVPMYTYYSRYMFNENLVMTRVDQSRCGGGGGGGGQVICSNSRTPNLSGKLMR